MSEATGSGTVQIAYLHDERPSHSWVESMRRMWNYDRDHGDNRLAKDPMNMRCGVAMVPHVRNGTARLFLDKTPHEWLMFIDTDMGFEPDAVHRLLAVADPVERPVVGGLCFASMVSGHDGMGGWRRTIVPTMYKMGTTDDGSPSFCFFGDYEDNTLTPVAATGGAFLLIHRGALEKLRAEHGDHWFDMMYDSVGDIVGEDISFCGRLLKAGIIPVVHTGVKTTHHKDIWLSEEDYEAQRALTVTIDPRLPVVIDLRESFAALARFEHDHDGMLKFRQDLDRYEAIIEATKPEVIVETGTRTGASARWFAEQGVDVITVDVNRLHPAPYDTGELHHGFDIWFLTGDSTDPAIAAKVAELVGGRRCMVTLDSDHSGPHVTKEIDLYGPLVSPGCYLVVEDGVFGYGQSARVLQGLDHIEGSPLDAIADRLVDNPDWSRDIAVERLSPISHNPAGWWIRNG
jgi:cephalosporin hydroxylase